MQNDLISRKEVVNIINERIGSRADSKDNSVWVRNDEALAIGYDIEDLSTYNN